MVKLKCLMMILAVFTLVGGCFAASAIAAGPVDCVGNFPPSLKFYAENVCRSYENCQAMVMPNERIECCNQAQAGVQGYLQSWKMRCSMQGAENLAMCQGYSDEQYAAGQEANATAYDYCMNPGSY